MRRACAPGSGAPAALRLSLPRQPGHSGERKVETRGSLQQRFSQMSSRTSLGAQGETPSSFSFSRNDDGGEDGQSLPGGFVTIIGATALEAPHTPACVPRGSRTRVEKLVL